MQKKTLINLLLLLVVAALALVAVFEPGIEAPQKKPSLLGLEREAVKHIHIQRQERPDIELQRDGDGWRLLQPVEARASGFRIDSLLRVTDSKSLGTFAADTAMLSDYQLDTPKVVLTLNRDTTIAFGNNTPLDHRRYVLLDDTVHLVSDTIYYHLVGAYPTFVSQRPLPQGAQIEAITMPGLALRWQENRWQRSAEDVNASADDIARLIDAWRYASALQVKPYDESEGEAVTIRLQGEKRPVKLLITAREPDLILARPELGIQYHFPAESATELLQLPAADSAAADALD
ncbi:MAG: DUF4340 domain-containing protein [Pseudomonadota bacterium]